MKVGDLVRPIDPLPTSRPCEMDNWTGVIIGWTGTEPVVFWNERFPAEVEYKEQIKVVNGK